MISGYNKQISTILWQKLVAVKTLKIILSFVFITLSLWSCEKYSIEMQDKKLVFPVGRSWLGESDLSVFLNNTEIHPVPVYDSCGGFWLKFTENELPDTGTLSIRFNRKKEELHLFQEPGAKSQKWLGTSYFLDHNNEILTLKALELTENIESTLEKAKRIQQFIIGHLEYRIYHNSFLDKASDSYDKGYGTCMNYSRLYVALCRAAGISARTVWGIVKSYDNDGTYDSHHQWAEVLDDSGYWHPADFTYSTRFDLNDIRYLDLIYGAEENTIFQSRENQAIILQGVEYFNNYPASLTGRLGFRLIEDNRPNSMTVEYNFKF